VLSTLLAPVDLAYRNRPRFFQLRAKAMLALYLAGAIAGVLALFGDLAQNLHSPWFHIAVDGGLALTLCIGFALVWLGKDDLGTAVVPIALVVFSVGTLVAALDGRPDKFYSGWARWYPVFIAVNALLMTQRSAWVVSIFSIGWTVAYYPLFSGALVGTPYQMVPGDMIDMVSIDVLTAVITIGTIRFIDAELHRNRALTASLEVTVQERTDELSTALEEKQAVLDNMADGLVSVGPDGDVRVVNDELMQMFHRDTLDSDASAGILAEYHSVIVAGVLPPDLWRMLERVRQSGEAATQHLDLPDERIAKVTVTPMPAAAGPYGVVGLVRDVTLEREVDRLKTEFIATVSHELRTPLTSVLGFTKMIERKLETRVVPALPAEDERAGRAMDQVLENVKIVLSEGQRLTALINDVLDIAKMEAGRVDWRRDPVDPAKLIKQSADAVAALFPVDHPVQLTVEVEDGLPGLIGDEHRLVQVLVNLLSNASKFTEHGVVTLAARRVDGGVELSVSDTGDGVPVRQRKAIFERFRQVEDTLTNKPNGTGLGLPICQQIARAHSTEVQLESVIGEGSRFSITLPLPEGEPASA
jgi:signal transduction histidine kinase